MPVVADAIRSTPDIGASIGTSAARTRTAAVTASASIWRRRVTRRSSASAKWDGSALNATNVSGPHYKQTDDIHLATYVRWFWRWLDSLKSLLTRLRSAPKRSETLFLFFSVEREARAHTYRHLDHTQIKMEETCATRAEKSSDLFSLPVLPLQSARGKANRLWRPNGSL